MDKKHSIKDVVKKQLEYCVAIKDDIVKHNGSEEVQKYAQKFAEIESPMIGGTGAEWIRINYGGIYIFIPLKFAVIDGHETYSLGLVKCQTEYQLDFLGEYGGELISNEYSVESFLAALDMLSDEEIEETYPLDWQTEAGDEIPSKYIPM